MKKIYFVIITLLFVTKISFTQQVEIIGNAISGQTTSDLNVDGTDLVNITLYAVYLAGSQPTSATVEFVDVDDNEDVIFQSADIYKTTFPNTSGFVYYKTNLPDIDAGDQTINVIPADVSHTHSFYAFVERDNSNADYYSVWDDTHVFYYHYGVQDESYTYSLALQASSYNRNITVTIPFSGVDSHPVLSERKAVVEVESGGITAGNTFSFNNIGNYFHIETLELLNVPSTATTVEITISSLLPVDEFDPGGDSFMTGGALIDVTEIDPGCTLTQGYWKTHGIEGPAGPYNDTWAQIEDETFFDSGMDYYDAIREKAKGNAYYMLAHQYIAAKLNGLSGADITDAQDAFDDATALFETYTPGFVKGLKGNNPIRKAFIDAADILADYNEGTIGPGHCDDDDKSALIITDSGVNEIVVYPNPISNYGTLDFIASENANTTIEIYNLVGTRMDILLNNYLEEGTKTSLNIDANKYPQGMYILYIRNGSTIYKEKISVMK